MINLNAQIIAEFAAFPGTFFSQTAHWVNDGIYHVFRDPMAFLTDAPRLTAAILILDRCYSTQVSRFLPEEVRGATGAHEFLAAHLVNPTNRPQFESIMKRALAMKGQLDCAKRNKICALVQEFSDLVRDICGDTQNYISFSSKFLHFVSRAIPPIDRDARRAIYGISTYTHGKLEDFCIYLEEFCDAASKLYNGPCPYTTVQLKTLDNFLVWKGRQ